MARSKCHRKTTSTEGNKQDEGMVNNAKEKWQLYQQEQQKMAIVMSTDDVKARKWQEYLDEDHNRNQVCTITRVIGLFTGATAVDSGLKPLNPKP